MPRKVLYLLLITTLIHQKYIAGQIITNSKIANDGFGSQFQAIIDSVIYAELNNYRYVYTPFKTMAHNYDNDANFILKKEYLINFINNFDTIDKINPREYSNIIDHEQVFYKKFFDANVSRCASSSSLKKIRTIFKANKNTHNYFNNENLNIAIHIRRPNPDDNRIEGTDTPDNVFLNVINKLREIYFSRNPLFHLHSQGNIEDFKTFNAQDIVLHINESTEDSFTSMVLADVLVIGVSTFSYTAGLLSEGIIYYIPFWHAPLPYWISIDALLGL